MNYKITPLVSKFKDPHYPGEIRIEHNRRTIDGEVIYLHDRDLGKFYFGDLKETINRLPTQCQNALKTHIMNEVFEQNEFLK